MPRAAFLNQRILNCIEINTEVTTRLTENSSLYEAYVEACRQQGQPLPMSLRAFTKRLEGFLEFHFKTPSTQTRDQKGILSPGVKLKSVNFTAFSRSLRFTFGEDKRQLKPIPGFAKICWLPLLKPLGDDTHILSLSKRIPTTLTLQRGTPCQ
jgi:hypothetical protein